MSKSISCSDAGNDCELSALAFTKEELIEKITHHVIEDHKEIELNSESISSIKSLFKDI
jgi:predicted small metal-binding protein